MMYDQVLFWMAVAVMLTIFVLLLFQTRKKQPRKLTLIYFANEQKIKSSDMAVIFKPNQIAEFQVEAQDRKGNPAKIQAGSIDYDNPNPDAFTVTENPDDETKFTVQSSANAVEESVSVDIRVMGDADLGDGVKTIETVLVCVIEPEGAEGFGIKTISEPTDVVV